MKYLATKSSLKTISIMEECHRHIIDNAIPEDNTDADFVKVYVRLGRKAFEASLNLEKLSTCFVGEAYGFLNMALNQPECTWPRLNELALSSRVIKSNTPDTVERLLIKAARVATRMPKLRKMDIWSQSHRDESLFRYTRSADSASIVWHGTWKFFMSDELIQAWQDVVDLHVEREPRLQVGTSFFKHAPFSNHGTVLEKLGLGELVIHPESLQQIRLERFVSYFP